MKIILDLTISHDNNNNDNNNNWGSTWCCFWVIKEEGRAAEKAVLPNLMWKRVRMKKKPQLLCSKKLVLNPSIFSGTS